LSSEEAGEEEERGGNMQALIPFKIDSRTK
jgi:hypothetical protein